MTNENETELTPDEQGTPVEQASVTHSDPEPVAVSEAPSEPVIVSEPQAVSPEPLSSSATSTSAASTSTASEPAASVQTQTATRAPSAFAGIPASDFVRDGVAALLLLVSLTMPWDYTHRSSAKIEVILITVLSLLSLTLPYLARAGVLPATWTVHTTRRVRLVANAPYGLLVLVYLVIDIARGSGTSAWGGVGTGAALGLAGAVLAAQPRQSELGPEDQDRAVSETWLRGLLILGGVVVATSLLAFVLALTNSPTVLGIAAALVVALFTVALVGLPVLGTWRRDESWRIVLVALGIVFAAIFLIGSGGNSLPQLESVHLLRFGFVLLPALAAAAASPAVRRAMRPSGPVETWVGVAVRGLDLVVVTAGFAVLQSALALADGARSVSMVLTLVFGLLIAAVAVLVRRSLAHDPVAGRTLALGGAGVVAVLGLVLLIVAGNQGEVPVGVEHLLLAFGLPLTVAYALTVPKEVRAHFTEHRPGVDGAGAPPANAYEWHPPAPRPVRVKPAPPVQAAAPQGYPGQQPGAGAPFGAPQGGHYAPQGSQYAPQAGEYGQPQQQGPAGAQPYPSQHYPSQSYAPQGGQSTQPIETDPGSYGARPGVEVSGESATQVLPTYPEPAYPEPVQPGVQPAGFTAEQALNPGTPLEVLAQIVQDAPHLRPQVAANPSTYPALLEWLGNLGDPAVDAALRSRGL